MTLGARYILGSKNVVADQLSCKSQVFGLEWSLHPLVVKETSLLWGSLLVVLFASALNRTLQVYCSNLPDPLTWQEDASMVSWNNLDALVFPPFFLIQRVLNKVLSS